MAKKIFFHTITFRKKTFYVLPERCLCIVWPNQVKLRFCLVERHSLDCFHTWNINTLLRFLHFLSEKDGVSQKYEEVIKSNNIFKIFIRVRNSSKNASTRICFWKILQLNYLLSQSSIYKFGLSVCLYPINVKRDPREGLWMIKSLKICV